MFKKKSKMRYIALLFLCLSFAICQSQEKELLIDEIMISDWSEYPIYPRLVEGDDDEARWRE